MGIKTVWKYSVKTEAERLIHTAHQITVGFYRVNNFIVLPFNPNSQTSHTVTFPDLPYHQIPRFWKQVKRLNISIFPLAFDKNLLNQIIRLMEKSKLPTPNYEKIRKTWEKVQDEVLHEIYRLIPAKKGLIEKIIIIPSAFGTSSSFNIWGKNEKKGVICIYLREDQGIHAICESILPCLNYADITADLEGIWAEAELLVDWLVTHSSLSQVLQKYEKAESYKATIRGIRTKQQAKLLQQSEEFYQKLGIPTFIKPFGLNGLMPEINRKPIENLNIKERIILKKLIENANSIVSIDEIADEICTNEEEFSLWALAKLIERLRTKLEQNGISGSFIQTLRGKGYVLKN